MMYDITIKLSLLIFIVAFLWGFCQRRNIMDASSVILMCSVLILLQDLHGIGLTGFDWFVALDICLQIVNILLFSPPIPILSLCLIAIEFILIRILRIRNRNNENIILREDREQNRLNRQLGNEMPPHFPIEHRIGDDMLPPFTTEHKQCNKLAAVMVAECTERTYQDYRSVAVLMESDADTHNQVEPLRPEQNPVRDINITVCLCTFGVIPRQAIE